MATRELPAPPQEKPGESRKAIIARFGTFYVGLPVDDSDGPAEWLGRFVETLDADPRVTKARPPKKIDHQLTRELIFYPASEDRELEADDLLAGAHMHGYAFAFPISLSLHVPKKNQPTYFEGDEVSSEDYLALWDGQTILVAWTQAEDAYINAAGGQVVAEILSDAAKKLDADLYVQGCHPGCPNLFLHTDLKVLPDSSASAFSHTFEDIYTLVVTAPTDESVENVTLALWLEYADVVREFARAKTLGRRILDLEAAVYRDLHELAELHHNRAGAANSPLPHRVMAIWTYRRWRRQSRAILARLWFALGHLASAHRAWMQAHFDFERSAKDRDLGVFFERDEADDFREVQDMDLAVVESSIEHASTRLDTSAVVIATVGGAIAGAVAGALVALA